LILALAFALAVALVRPANACGFWRMSDTEKHFSIGWLINSASIEQGDKRLAALYLDIESKSGLRTTLGKQVVYDIAGDTVRHAGKAIGKLRADGSVGFGDHVYAIELSDPRVVEQRVRMWTLTVKRNDTTVITAENASALCNAMGPDNAAKAEDEVRRRVIYYLAWREGR
jgi:hypothetical protein